MKNKAPALKLRTAFFKGGFIHNPVLTQIIGICPIVAAATTLKNALVLSLVLTVSLIVNESFTSLFLKDTPRYVRLCFYTVISTLIVVLSGGILAGAAVISYGPSESARDLFVTTVMETSAAKFLAKIYHKFSQFTTKKDYK